MFLSLNEYSKNDKDIKGISHPSLDQNQQDTLQLLQMDTNDRTTTTTTTSIS
jgi:hypothetical protein